MEGPLRTGWYRSRLNGDVVLVERAPWWGISKTGYGRWTLAAYDQVGGKQIGPDACLVPATWAALEPLEEVVPMEILQIEWHRPTTWDAGIPSVAAAMRVSVATPEEASRLFNALASVLRALTVDEVPPPEGPHPYPGDVAARDAL